MRVITTEDMEELAATASDPTWEYLPALQASLASHRQDIATFRAALTEGDAKLQQRF
jgi:hypothetical protein